ncbi:MAG TPA: hypothetical protein VLK84_16585 [Longimicrobium sp.]|nr:hypothetical protein [Longimicrobium sp.]
MLRALVRSASASAFLLLAEGLAAQSAPRVVVVPQVGTAVRNSFDMEQASMASLMAEWRPFRFLALTAEGTAALGDPKRHHCSGTASCFAPATIRSGATAGVVIRPFQLGPVAPYAGASLGVARWEQAEWGGNAPLATLRAGVDVRIAGPFGVRADVARRTVWSEEIGDTPAYTDVVSLGTSFAVGR